MRFRFLLLFAVGAWVPAFAITVDPDIYQYGVGKTHGYTQTGPTTITATSYDFSAFVDATTNGVINAAKVYGPLAGYFDAHGPQDLVVHSGGAEFKVTGYLNQGSLNTDFPNDNSGNYKLLIDAGALGGSLAGGYDYEIKFNLGGDAYPTDIPAFTLNNGSWQGGTYVIAANDGQTMFGWTFPGYNPSTDVVLFNLRPTNGGDDVLSLQFQGSNPGGYTLAANTLSDGVAYTAELTFARIVDSSSDVLGAQGVAYYAVSTSFNLQAVPEPSTYALLVLGLGVVLVFTRRRRNANRG